MSDLAYSKSALRTLRRLPPAMVQQIQASAAQSLAAQRSLPSGGDAAIRRLEGQGWRITINAQGTVLAITPFTTAAS